MRVPAVIGCQPSMCDLKGADLPDVAHLSKNLLHLAISQKALQRFCLQLLQLVQPVMPRVRCGQRQEMDFATLGAVHVHGLLHFQLAAFCDLWIADRATPYVPAGL